MLQVVQVGQQFLGVGGDLKEPLLQFQQMYFGVAAPAEAAFHLLVGQDGLAFGAPVHRGFFLISQAPAEHLDEDQLLPAVVVRIAGGQLPGPVVAVAQGLELVAHIVDIVVGPVGGVQAPGHGRVLRGQPEGVPAHGMEHVEAPHTFVAGHHVADGVVAHVAHVDAP